MKKIIEFLKSRDLMKKSHVNEDNISRLRPSKIIDLAEELESMTVIEDRNDKPSIFRHCASISLGGGGEDCIALDCRRERLNEMLQFAVLFSDRVHIQNYFSEYRHMRHADESIIKEKLYNDLDLVLYLQPFFNKKLVVFLSAQPHLCPNCMAAKLKLDSDSKKRFINGAKKIELEYLKALDVSFVKGERVYEFVIEASPPFLEHGNRIEIVSQIPDIISSNKVLMNKLNNDGEISLSHSIKKQVGFHRDLAYEVINNVSYGIAASQVLGSSFLTEKSIHVDYMKEISGNEEFNKKNTIALKHLTTIIPFLKNVEIKNLIKLREREGDSFLQFRAVLGKAISEFRSTRGTFSEKDARILYSDVIEPKLSSLEKRVDNAKKDLISSTYRPLIGAVGAISFGLFSGFLSSELLGIAGALGFTKFSSDLIQNVMSLGDGYKEIRNEDLYFLWKVKRKQSHHL